MSGAVAIAAVTATLRSMLETAVNEAGIDASITLKVPTLAAADDGTQLGLFLYHVSRSAAWQNRDMPNRVAPGESGASPLAVTLHYLLTAYGPADASVTAHQALGLAMRTLHDHPVLTPEEIELALPNSGLPQQPERVRITHETLSLDGMFKLWGAFQTAYRPSVAYQATVVLIDSQRPVRAALPVLSRGRDDEGPTSRTSAVPPLPTIERVEIPSNRPAARVDDIVILRGHDLHADAYVATVSHARWSVPLELTVLSDPAPSPTAVHVLLGPGLDDELLVGVLSLRLSLTRGAESLVSNAVALAVAPTLAPPTKVGAGLRIDFTPHVVPGQQVSLFVGSRELPHDDVAAPSRSLTFDAPVVPDELAAGAYLVRLRVDGVDSDVIADRTARPPEFDRSMEVELP